MDIYLDRRAVRQIRLSAQEAIEQGDTEALREDILEAFDEEQIEEIERRLDSADCFEFLTDILDEWSGDDVEELFELLDTQLSEVGVDLKFDGKEDEEEEEEEEEDVDEDDDFIG
jgi:Mg/Co/Ni transporter MgtE